jgi:hypothetical protein
MLLNRHMTLREIAANERFRSLRKAIEQEQDYIKMCGLLRQMFRLIDEVSPLSPI